MASIGGSETHACFLLLPQIPGVGFFLRMGGPCHDYLGARGRAPPWDTMPWTGMYSPWPSAFQLGAVRQSPQGLCIAVPGLCGLPFSLQEDWQLRKKEGKQLP